MLSANQIKLIKSLHQKKMRNEHQLFLAEGKKTIEEFINSGWSLTHLLETDTVFAPKLQATKITENTLQKISALTTSNNCLAVFKIPSLSDIQHTESSIVLDSIRDPGNLGTIIRLCDWFGFTQIVCSEDTADCYNPKVVQASMGSLARVRVHYTNIVSFLEISQLPVVGTFMDGMAVYETTIPQKANLIMGNEGNGISTAVANLCNHKIAIPKFGALQKTESLNVATATAILLSEWRRNN